MSKQTQPSATAEGTALIRALGGKDGYAHIFLPQEKRDKLGNAKYREAAAAKFSTYDYVLHRTDFFDTEFSRGARGKIPQIIILGAGYDTRALRFKDELTETHVFEVDAPFTARQKLDILRDNRIDAGHIAFVSVDFETDDLFERLRHAGLDTDKEALILWEGVTLYLTAEAVDATLKSIRGALRKFTLVLDYLCVLPTGNAVKRDEKILFGLPKEGMMRYLEDNGLTVAGEYQSCKDTMRYVIAKT
jgi:methyltransferase (TIGR00027 family)